MAAQATLDSVQKLYIAYFGRAADDAGLNFWANAIESGLSTIESVATGFTLTPEYSSIYGNLSAETLVEQIYQNTFGRASDPAGKAFWVNLLATGAISADTIAHQMISNMGDVDKALVDQKVVASNTYTHTAGVNYDIAAGKNVLAEINAGVGAADPTPPTSTPNPTATVINSGAGRDTIILTSAAEKVVIAAGNSAATEKASLDVAEALVTARTALEDGAASAEALVTARTALEDGAASAEALVTARTALEDGAASAEALVTARTALEDGAASAEALVTARTALEDGAASAEALVTARTALEDGAASAEAHATSFTTLITAYNQALTNYTDLVDPTSEVALENAYAALTTYSGIKFPLISAAVEIESADAITQNTFVNETAELSTALGAAQTALNGDVAAHGTTPELSTALGAAQTALNGDVAAHGTTLELSTALGAAQTALNGDVAAHGTTLELSTALGAAQTALNGDVAAHGTTLELSTALGAAQTALNGDVAAHGTTLELSTALGAAQTALNGDVAAHGTTPELTTALGAAQTAFDTTFVASASPANQTDHDIITGFSLSADKLDLPETIVLTGTFSTVQTGNSLSITTNSNGVVEFGNATVNTTIEEKVSALLTAMGTAKATAAFVDNNNTYVVQGDGVSGLQSSDILVELTGVSNVTQLSTFII